MLPLDERFFFSKTKLFLDLDDMGVVGGGREKRGTGELFDVGIFPHKKKKT